MFESVRQLWLLVVPAFDYLQVNVQPVNFFTAERLILYLTETLSVIIMSRTKSTRRELRWQKSQRRSC